MREGEVHSPSEGETITCIRSGQGGGSFIFDLELAPGFKGPPMHSHDEGDETIEVHSGEIVFRVGKENKHLRAGESLTLRSDQPHTFWNPSRSESVRCRVTHGSRFERLISQPDFTSLAMYIAHVDPGASRLANPVVRAVVRVVAALGKLRGKKPVVLEEQVPSQA
jgi:uncharacterized cupin superfamily protein